MQKRLGPLQGPGEDNRGIQTLELWKSRVVRCKAVVLLDEAARFVPEALAAEPGAPMYRWSVRGTARESKGHLSKPEKEHAR